MAAVFAGAFGFLVATAAPAYACTLAFQSLTLDVAQGTPGGQVHVSGGPYFEVVPVDERPSTTTTTLPGGGVVVGCPPTRPATHQEIAFLQNDRRVVVGEVDGDSLDLDITIPSDATLGAAKIYTSVGAEADIQIVRQPVRPRLARTGAAGLIEVGVAVALIAIGLVTLTKSRRLRESSRMR
jgi:hypothetical protein